MSDYKPSGRQVSQSWEMRSLGQMADIAGGVTLGRSLSGSSAIELPYLRVANVQDGYVDTTDLKLTSILRDEVDRYRLLPGDVLMTEGGDFDKLGRGAVWDGSIEPCLHQNHIFRVRCHQSILEPRYLALYSASHDGRRYFLQCSKQTTNLASINITQLRAFPVPTPPWHVQRSVIRCLDTVDEAIQSTERLIAKLELVRRGILQDLVMASADESSMPRAGQVRSCQLGDVCRLQVGFAFSSEWFTRERGVRLLRGENVGYGRPEWADVYNLPEERARRHASYLLFDGDVIIGMDRSFTKSGFKVSRLTGHDVPALLVQRVGRFVPTGISSEFLWCVLNSDAYQSQLVSLQRGMDIPHLSSGDILSPRIAIPSPDAQARGASAVLGIERRIQEEARQLVKVQSLRAALLNDLLTGTVRLEALAAAVSA